MKRGARPIWSLWSLLARSSIYRILAVLTLMALAETAMFWVCVRSGRGYTLTEAVEGSRISVVFLAALGFVFFILVRAEGHLDEKSGNTMLRLRMSGRGIFVVKAVYNMLALTMLFAVQIWLAVWLVNNYGEMAEAAGEYVSPQLLFMAFYRIEFLHSLLPMAEVGKWVRNLLLVTAFGMEAAAGVGKKNYYVPALLYVMTAAWFVSPIGGNFAGTVCLITYMVLIAVNMWRLWRRDEKAA